MSGMTLEQKLNNFNTKYSVNLDPKAIAEAARIDAVFGDYRFQREDRRLANATTYWNALKRTLEKSIIAKTKINADANYNLSDFNLEEFVNSFEEIMKESHEQSTSTRERKPFEGMRFESVIERARQSLEPYNVPLYSIWARKALDGKITYNDLKTVTDGAMSRVENAHQSGNTAVSENDVTNVVYAHEAMFRVCQSRGFWWKVFHPIDNYREQKYLETLSNRISTYIERNYPIGRISDNVPDSAVGQVYGNVASPTALNPESTTAVADGFDFTIPQTSSQNMDGFDFDVPQASSQDMDGFDFTIPQTGSEYAGMDGGEPAFEQEENVFDQMNRQSLVINELNTENNQQVSAPVQPETTSKGAIINK